MNFFDFYNVVEQNSGCDTDLIVFVYNDARDCCTIPEQYYELSFETRKAKPFKHPACTIWHITSSDSDRACQLSKQRVLDYLKWLEARIDPDDQFIVSIDGQECLTNQMWAQVAAKETNWFLLSDGGSQFHSDPNPDMHWAMLHLGS